MKQVSLLVFGLVAVSLASVPPLISRDVKFLKYENEILGGTGHKYSFVQSDGIEQEQEGQLKKLGGGHEVYVLKGRYAWVGPNGVKYTVNYVADENGYQPQIKEGFPALPSSAVAAISG